MPGNDFDQEALLAFVSELTKRVEDLKKEIGSIGAQAGTGMQKLSEETERFGRTIDRDAKSLKGLREQGSGLVGTMRGAAGLGVALYGAGQAMENFARNSLQLRNFATDVGLTTTEVNKLKTQLTAAGIDGSAANQQLGSLSAKLDNIRVYGAASPVLKAIAANDPILARQLADAEKAGNRMKSVDAIVQRWNTGPRSQLYITEQLGVTPSMMRALERNREGLVQPREYSPEELQKYNDDWHNATQTIINLLGATAMTITSQTNQFMENTKREFSGITSWFGGLKRDFEGKGKPGEQIFGPKGVLPNKQEVEGLFGPKGILPNKKEMDDALESLKRLFSTEAHAAEPTGADSLLEGGADSFVYRFGDWEKQKLDVQKDSSQVLEDIRDLLRGESGSGGPMGVGGAGYGGADGGGVDSGPGGQAAVRDEAGNPIDQETMKQAEALGRAGDTAGLQKLFASRGYRMSGAACGIVASKYARAAGFEPPKSGAVATSWHKWGEQSSAEDVNKPDRPFGSIMGTYYHRRYGGNPNEVLKPGQTGGHVMTIVPGSYDPKTRTVGVVDQYGFKRRKIDDIDFRYAGDQAVKEAERIRKGEGRTPADPEAARKKIDSSFPGMRTPGTARVDVEFNGVPKGVKTEAELLDEGVFSTLNIKKSPAAQQPQPN